jgi:hypothetical protein
VSRRSLGEMPGGPREEPNARSTHGKVVMVTVCAPRPMLLKQTSLASCCKQETRLKMRPRMAASSVTAAAPSEALRVGSLRRAKDSTAASAPELGRGRDEMRTR